MVQIPIADFEQYIDEKVLERGFSLFENRKISEIVQQANGVSEAIVHDGADFMVELTIKNENLVNYSCTCKESMNPVCKHITAVILEMQQDSFVFEQEIKPKKTRIKKSNNAVTSKKETKEVGRPKKFKSAIAQADDILKRVSLSELTEFVRERVKGDKFLRDLLVAHFNYIYEDESKKEYLDKIDVVIKFEVPRNQLPSKSIGKKIIKLLNPLAVKAKECHSQGNYLSYFWIYTALLEKLSPYFGVYYDYSCPAINEFVELLLTELTTFSKEVPNPAMRKLVFDYGYEGIKTFESNYIPMILTVLNLAYNTVEGDEEIQKLLNITSKTGIKSTLAAALHENNLDLIYNFYGNEAGEKYILDHIEVTHFKLLAIDIMNKKSDFAKVLEIAEAYIKNITRYKFEKDYEKNSLLFYSAAFNAAMELKNKNKSIGYGTTIVLDLPFDEGKDYFAKIKALIPNKEFPVYSKATIAGITKTNYGSFDKLLKFYRHAEMWNELLVEIERSESLDSLESYEDFIPEQYHSKIGEVYTRILSRKFLYYYGSKDYSQYINKVHQYSGYIQATTIITKYKAIYKRDKEKLELIKEIEENIINNKKTFGR